MNKDGSGGPEMALGGIPGCTSPEVVVTRRFMTCNLLVDQQN